jgi:Asp-tRNA(Asn)/Glu-tRNA(Gln) amidotransferase A subunit family amidase
MDHEWPATAVTMAFLYSAGISQYLVNNLTELLPTRAMDRAQWLDGYYLEHGKPFGPLHGFPISVNDHFEFKGLWRSTDGYVCNWEHIAEEDNRILQALHNAGAVFHCRTTSPQTMMLLETQSNLYGITKNPYNTNHTSGGSCGGEGALVALRGSSIGIGTDSAGSIRCPAAFCGEYAFKPTGARIPPHECRCVHDNDDCVLGVISTHLSGVQLFMKTIVDSQPWPVSDRGNKSPEPEVVPWRDIEDLKTVLHNPAKLRIGVLWHDGVVTPQPPITRALRMLANELKRTSRKFTDPEIEIIDFSPYSHEEAWATIASLYFSGAKDTVRNSLKRSGEPELPITSNFLKYQHMFTGLMDNETLEDRKSWREDYKKEYAEHWEKYNIDVLLCPATPGIAPPHGEAHYYGYSTQWNCLDYPALVFPVTYVDKEVDVYPNEKLKPDTPNNMAIRNTFDPEEMHGMPVALQLVGRPLEDEKVLKVLEYITGSDGLNLWLPTTSF